MQTPKNPKAKDYQEKLILAWTEAAFQNHVEQLATAHGWLTYHTYNSMRSNPGFPDLTMVHPEHGLVFIELKTEKGRVKPDQKTWLAALKAADQYAEVWRPRDLVSGEVERLLTHGLTPTD